MQKFSSNLRQLIHLSKYYIPSITFEKRFSPKPFGGTKNGLVFDRLVCTKSETEILNKIVIYIDFNPEFLS